jgi:hypothetical protein
MVGKGLAILTKELIEALGKAGPAHNLEKTPLCGVES